ncbi:DNA invertase Pin-like site-specific DNA recombinase [Actinocrispum wychmicini]|uniref:DNA invertase Pin-like site-specific DNA recombinase n=2 Tax=Actinocrispum wychmicini TaxID=1213861 RepID=A0A4R2J7B1_9PSEU|nr:DNA invertase Pin-like site-specific DNA recombinase [Actinocrispum wychmicini]
MERERRSKAIRAGRDGRDQRLNAGAVAGQPAAVYCRISKADDDDQTGVDRQERLCREVADRLGLVVTSDSVFVDPNRSAWKRDRKRPGWDKLIDAMRNGRFRNVIVYHPDRLMRQPKDLEELLTISDEYGIVLHGQANRRDLSDPDDRFFLRIEVAHACRSSDDTSRRIKDKLADRALDGLPHTPGRRRFGYTIDGMTIIEDEAEVIRDVYSAYLDGMSPRDISAMLTERGFKTVFGNTAWSASTVRRLLSSPYLTGILVFRGEMIGEGAWSAIIDRGTWNEVQERRAMRASAYKIRANRYYFLRGLVMCRKCATHMSGSGTTSTPEERQGKSKRWPMYRCTRSTVFDKKVRCARGIGAAPLEKFVVDAAIELLTTLDLSGSPAAVTLTKREKEAITADEQELAELKDMWKQREVSTREYREMRRTVEERISKIRHKTAVRPTADVLAGLVGEHARDRWNELVAREDYERMNAVLRFLFAAVIIDEHRGPSNKFDYSRIEIEPNPL